jgi:cytochrome c biogenesis protein CcdA
MQGALGSKWLEHNFKLRIHRNIVNPVLSGGILAGGLHAVTGPDHLAAILPASVGQNFLGGAKIGAVWGLGHGVTATILGAFAFFLKGKISSKFKFVEKLSSFADYTIGLSLIVIGLIGAKESLETTNKTEADTADGSLFHSAPIGDGMIVSI